MGLSDDLPEDDLKTAEQNEAEQIARAVLEATEASEVAEALEGVSDLLVALWNLDEDAFDGESGYAEPEFYAQCEWASMGIEASDYEGAGEIEISSESRGKVSLWASIPGLEHTGVAFDLSPASAIWLSEILPEFAARAQDGEHWQHLKHTGEDDE